MKNIALAVHGGAGTIVRAEMSAEAEAEYRAGLRGALLAGWKILQAKGSALDAVEESVVALENHPLFNAGRGAVFTHDGINEMDAAIMDGERFKAGAVTMVRNVVNPIKLARLVMEKTEHILLGGDGALKFAEQMKIETAPDDYFYTEHRYRQLQQAHEHGVVQLDHAADEKDEQENSARILKPFGTVGAVACDAAGNLAAATSTGGMTNKKFGRIGDSPIIGAGTYAENAVCAVSCTGHGEYFMLGATAFDVAARMKYKNLSLPDAARETIERQTEIGGEGGLIAVDSAGNIALPFNSDGMYRASISGDGEINVEIWK